MPDPCGGFAGCRFQIKFLSITKEPRHEKKSGASFAGEVHAHAICPSCGRQLMIGWSTPFFAIEPTDGKG